MPQHYSCCGIQCLAYDNIAASCSGTFAVVQLATTHQMQSICFQGNCSAGHWEGPADACLAGQHVLLLGLLVFACMAESKSIYSLRIIVETQLATDWCDIGGYHLSTAMHS